MTDGSSATVHATCVAWDAQAVLITGKSGQGKSGLGLALMALGCVLVADDRVQLTTDGGELFASPPPNIAGLIEARGIGILNAVFQERVQVRLVVDLDRTETARLPQRRFIPYLGCSLPLIYGLESPHLAASLLQLLKAGWSDR